MDDDRMSQLRQGVKRFARWHGIDVPATEAMMTDAANELDRLRNINEAVVVELARGIRYGYQCELDRLRKIEALARQIDDWMRDNPAQVAGIRAAVVAWQRAAPRNALDSVMESLKNLRKSLETDADG